MTSAVSALTLALVATVSAPQVHLLTMGPGDHLYTRGGHAALMVVEPQQDGPLVATVYNYGDTDWDDPDLARRFFEGTILFRLADPMSLEQVLQTYGVEQNRDIFRQQLNLSTAEITALRQRLAHDLEPENRAYPYHHVDAICSTRIRDLLEEVTGGALSEQLSGQLDEHTVRDYQQMAFEWIPWALLSADVLLGARHDHQPTEYEVLFQPRRMRDLLQRVKLPPLASGGPPRLLAGAPSPLTQRAGGPAIRESTKSAHVIRIALFWLFAASLGWAIKAPATARRWQQLWVGAAFGLSGLLGSMIAGLAALSRVPELATNELIYTFPPTDLLVAGVALWASVRDRDWPRWLYLYGLVRLGTMGAVVAGHALGLLGQRPWIYPLMGLLMALGLWWICRQQRASATSGDLPPLTVAVSAPDNPSPEPEGERP